MSVPKPRCGDPLAIVVMGVSGCGKTTLGRRLAQDFDVAFLEGDEFHTERNVQKMASGIALDDDDRWPWLESLGLEVGRRARADGVVVAACSALKKSYRDLLRNKSAVTVFFACLQAPPALLSARINSRRGHYMPASLLGSQVAILEPPDETEAATILDSQRDLEELAASVHAALDSAFRPSGRPGLPA